MKTTPLSKAQGARLKQARISAGYRSARDAALTNDWSEQTYRAHEGGWRTIGQDDAERYAKRYRFDGVNVTAQGILFGDTGEDQTREDGSEVVRIMGIIHTGGLIETNTNQAEQCDELIRVTIPFRVPAGTIAFRVSGLSMHPRYDPDDIVLCLRSGEPIDSVVGLYAAVMTGDGNRYLKRVLRGTKRGHYHLESHNAVLMPDIRLTWASSIMITVHAQHWQRIQRNGIQAAE